ncbi:MAG: AraC family transcriptional regulator [Spirochaetota bacterium]
MRLSAFFIEDIPARHSSGEHAHDFCEIVFVDGSMGSIVIGGRQLPFDDGAVLIHAPGSKHVANTDNASRHFCLGVTGWEIEGLSDGVYAGSEAVRRLFYDIERELREKRAYFKAIIELKASEIIIELKRSGNDTRSEKDSPADAAKVIIDEHYRESIGVTYLSDTLMLSKDYLRHEFKKQYGISPMQYLIGKRIENAKKMLDETPLKIRDVAVQSGFENEYYFSRIFRKIAGISPRAYRDRPASLPRKASAHKEYYR